MLREEPRAATARPMMPGAADQLRQGVTAHMAEIARRLADSRLVTLVGPGGAGKTRLASTVAAGLDRPVWLVELAPVTNPDDVPQAVLDRVGAGQTKAQEGTLSRIVEVLSARRERAVAGATGEHLIDAAARLADELLGLCPRLTVLATSRECARHLRRVALAGAAAGRRTGGPAVPRPGRGGASRVRPHGGEHAGRPGDLPPPRRVAHWRSSWPRRSGCARSPWIRWRPGSTTGSGCCDGREPYRHAHVTRLFGAVVAWSWDLLGDDERDLAERLAVFPGGFTAEAAEALGGSLDLLASLADRSLLQLIDGPRYRMLETIREYGLERLAERGEVDEVRRRPHTRYFLDLAEQGGGEMRGHGQLTWIRVLGADHDNLLAAFHYAIERGDARTATRMTAALGMFWMITGRRAESRALAQVGARPRR